MKKYLLSVALLASFCLLGCGGKSNTPTPDNNTGNTSPPVSPTATVTTFYPSFFLSNGLASDQSANIYISDGLSISKLTAAGTISKIATTINISPGALFFSPSVQLIDGVCLDATGNIYVASASSHRILKLTSSAVSDFSGSGLSGSANGPGFSASFMFPRYIIADPAGNIYVADNRKIRKVAPDGEVSDIAGGDASGYDEGLGPNARFIAITGIAIDASGNLLVIDGNRIRKITPPGLVSTFAGAIQEQYVDGPLESARFRHPNGIALDATGNIYIADNGNNRIRKINTYGIVSTFAGTGVASNLDGAATSAAFNGPTSLAFDSSGNLYVGDSDGLLRKITINK